MNRSNFFGNNNRYFNDNSCNNRQDNYCHEENHEDSCCCDCPPGPRGPQGPVGETGPAGPQGEPGGVLNFADFYALMPPDNAATVAPGTDVSFPRDGSVSSLNIVRTGPSSFNLTEVGTYNYTSCWRNASRFCTSGYCPVTVIGIYRWI